MPSDFPPEIPGLVRGVQPPRRKKRPPFSAKALFRRLLLVTLLLMAVVLAASMLGKPFARCMKLRHEIKDALASATEVRLVEHSNYWDTERLTPNQPPLGDFREKVYASITLTPQQVAELRTSLPISLDFGEQAKCRFKDHHRIEALLPDGSTFTLALCFRCRELSVGGEEKHSFPLRWNKSLRKFIDSLGMKPDGPWGQP